MQKAKAVLFLLHVKTTLILKSEHWALGLIATKTSFIHAIHNNNDVRWLLSNVA